MQMISHKLKSVLYNNNPQTQTLKHLKQIHALILINGLSNLQSLMARQITLLSNHTPFSLNFARYVHRLLRFSPNLDASSWSFAVRFFSANGQFETAFSLYVLMQRQGLSPISFAFSSSLKACSRIGHKLGGFSVHSQIHKMGFGRCVYVQTSLLGFYCKISDMESAVRVFDEMPERNVVSWNSMLSGFLRSGDMDAARRVFEEIPRKDAVSWNSMITGFARLGDMESAVRLFDHMPERNLASWNAMISGFASCGNMESARRVFEAMPLMKNKVSWIAMISGYSKARDVISARSIFDQMKDRELFAHNAMIACYEQNNHPKEALALFNQMVKPGANVHPDEMTLTSVVSACSQLGYLEFGSHLESYMKEHGIRMDDHLANAFIDLYAKCGSIDKAFELFRGMRTKDLVSYSAMITGCGVNGRAYDAINLFREMVNAKIFPNHVTYKGLLTAYNHAGLVEQGLECFTSMKGQGVMPSVDHYGIMVDLLGRAGRLEEAHGLIQSMPVQPHAGVWGALLLACRLHNNVELGEIAARKCFELQPWKTGYSSLLANIYASVERWDEAGRLRRIAEEKGIAKTPGCSWMESA